MKALFCFKKKKKDFSGGPVVDSALPVLEA